MCEGTIRCLWKTTSIHLNCSRRRFKVSRNYNNLRAIRCSIINYLRCRAHQKTFSPALTSWSRAITNASIKVVFLKKISRAIRWIHRRNSTLILRRHQWRVLWLEYTRVDRLGWCRTVYFNTCAFVEDTSRVRARPGCYLRSSTMGSRDKCWQSSKMVSGTHCQPSEQFATLENGSICNLTHRWRVVCTISSHQARAERRASA